MGWRAIEEEEEDITILQRHSLSCIPSLTLEESCTINEIINGYFITRFDLAQ
jgi:hypothetical protein